jgi:hypothetical protein
MNDPVNNPAHYTNHPSGIECIQVTEHMNFNRGNAVKYIWRCGDKGKPVEDLRKAIWYLEREIARLEQPRENPSYAQLRPATLSYAVPPA